MKSVAIGFGVRFLTVMMSTGRIFVLVGKIFRRRPAAPKRSIDGATDETEKWAKVVKVAGIKPE